jgi:hypothetical protein
MITVIIMFTTMAAMSLVHEKMQNWAEQENEIR